MELTDYHTALWGIALIILMMVIQWLIATVSKASQKGAIPGKIDESLSHDSFVFRAHRTFMNSMENLPMMMSSAFLALFVGASPTWTSVFIWAFLIARLGHMALYYGIATEKNPSPRSYFFALGFFASSALLILTMVTLAGF